MQESDAYVVDASVAVKWHLPDEDYIEEALIVLRLFVGGAVHLFAPEHIRYEVPNALTTAARRAPARLSSAQAQVAVENFLALPLTTFTDTALLRAAYPLAQQHSCAFYDAVYLALAQRVHCPLVVADRRFYRRVRDLPLVVWIGDVHSPL